MTSHNLGEIDWNAVQAVDWQQSQEGKQVEFLIEDRFPWELVSRVGVQSQQVSDQVSTAVQAAAHRPLIDIRPNWYY